MTEDEYKRWHHKYDRLMDGEQEAQLVEYVNNFSKEQAIQRIQEVKALPYMSKLFEQRLYMCQYWKSRRKVVEHNPDFEIPTPSSLTDKVDYFEKCLLSDRIYRWILRDLYNVVLQLQKHIIAAASSDLLDDISLKRLRAKMFALQSGFQEACEELGETKERLVWNSQTWW